MHEYTQKLGKSAVSRLKDAKCVPPFMARKRFFRGLLQNFTFCNSPLRLSGLLAHHGNPLLDMAFTGDFIHHGDSVVGVANDAFPFAVQG